MTNPTQAEKQFLDAVRQGQQVIVDGVGAWAKSVESLSVAYPPVPEPPERPTPQQVVDNAFDFAEKLLAAQREFARSLLEAAAPAFQGSATPEGDGPATPPPTHG
jgi:hypothetical protein